MREHQLALCVELAWKRLWIYVS